MKKILVVLVLATVAIAGCRTRGIAPSSLSQAQLNAIETRVIDADINEAFSAAVSALFDAGYIIAVSDREAGIITGSREINRQSERIWISPYTQDTRFAISVQLRQTNPARTSARVKLSINGEPRVDKETIDEIWNLMQRQVLMSAPPALSQ